MFSIKNILTAGCALLFLLKMGAHPMPNSQVGISVRKADLRFEILVPLPEFETAFGKKADPADPQPLADYFQKHIKIAGADGVFWKIEFDSAAISRTTDANIGASGALRKPPAVPPPGANLRQFTLFYDAVMHQVVTHQALVHVEQDWGNGIGSDHPQALAAVNVDTETGQILPVLVNLAQGSWRKGAESMFRLGMAHIAEGADHLMFLLLLLLVAPLRAEGGRWAGFGGLRFGLWRMVKMVTAFTLGHSLTLALCSIGWFVFSTKWVEILVAASILVSAIHAVRPLFFQREILVAAAFGLVHGMAFSNTLAAFELGTAQLIWSILGFNLGIEAVQVFIVALVAPLLIICSKSTSYIFFRNGLALFGAASALGWIAQRLTGEGNAVARFADGLVQYPSWILGGLLVWAGLVFMLKKVEAKGFF